MVDFADSPTDAAFRREVRSLIQQEFEPRRRAIRSEGRAAESFAITPTLRQWYRQIAARGWVAPAWPKNYGGAGMTIKQQFIYNEEIAEARAVTPGGIAIAMVGPTIITIGTDEQKAEHLPPILSGETIWCQGYSEPGAGSDLASLQTRAVRDGDDFVVNGQKIWTSGAHNADWMILLARTDPEAAKHKGITYFVLDMHAPGVQVQPLLNMAGTHEFNEVFFEDVRVPARNILGEENRGWYGAVTTLDFERSSIGSAVGMQQAVGGLVRAARDLGGSNFAGNSQLRLEIADRIIETQVARMISYRIVTMQTEGLIPNHEASMAKLYAMELNQRIASTGMHLLGLHGQLTADDPRAPRHGLVNFWYQRSIANTIEGGTSEIQRNIIATRGLGLPRS